MWGNIEMEVPFTKYTANDLTVCSQMICSVISKWHFHFYLSLHSDFGFFSCVGYLYPKDDKSCKKQTILFFDFTFLPTFLCQQFCFSLKRLHFISNIKSSALCKMSYQGTLNRDGTRCTCTSSFLREGS